MFEIVIWTLIAKLLDCDVDRLLCYRTLEAAICRTLSREHCRIWWLLDCPATIMSLVRKAKSHSTNLNSSKWLSVSKMSVLEQLVCTGISIVRYNY